MALPSREDCSVRRKTEKKMRLCSFNGHTQKDRQVAKTCSARETVDGKRESSANPTRALSWKGKATRQCRDIPMVPGFEITIEIPWHFVPHKVPKEILC